MKLPLLAIAVLLIVASLAAGCGSMSITPPPFIGVDRTPGTPTAEPTATPTPTATVSPLGPDSQLMMEDLHASGASVQLAGEITQPFFSVQGFVLRVNGAEVQVFEYVNEGMAAADAKQVSADGTSVRATMIAWIAPPHFFKRDRLIALYVGNDLSVVKALEAVLGPQFAGRIAAGEGTASAAGKISGRVWNDVCVPLGTEGNTPSPSSYYNITGTTTPMPSCVRSADGKLRANGVFDPDEAGVRGVRVALGTGTCPAGEQASATTAADGSYSFNSLNVGTYCVSIDANAAENSPLSTGVWTYPPAAGDGTARITVVLGDGETRSNVNFGWDSQVQSAPTATPKPCTDIARLVSDVTVPDNSRMTPNQSFDKTWRLKNAGTCTWDTTYALVFAKGDAMGAPTSVPFTTTVSPGNNVDLTVRLTAPNAAGTYRSNWQLKNGGGKVFGIPGSDPSFWALIRVVGKPVATTPTPTRTVTPTPTPIVVATATPMPVEAGTPDAGTGIHGVPTATPIPAATPTALPTPYVWLRISFPQGSTVMSFSTSLTQDRNKGYHLQATAGQRMKIDVGNPTAAFWVYDPNGQLLSVTGASEGGHAEFQLPATGDYSIVLSGSGQTLITVEVTG